MRGRVLVGSTLIVALLPACAPAASVTSPETTVPPATSAPVLPGSGWPTYHGNGERSGYAAGLPAAGPLHIAWTRRLPGAVYGQPLAIGQIVVAATEQDVVYALNLRTGEPLWHVRVGRPVPLARLPCGNIDPLGITSTPAYDAATGLVYVVAETTGFHHELVGIALRTGRVAFRRDVPTPDGHPRDDQQRGALLVAFGRVYIPFGGLFGDCGRYRGSIVAVPAGGRGKSLAYTVPVSRMGAIWAPGGPVLGPRHRIYAAVGNGAATGPPYDGSDSVIALSPTLRRVALFAPASWAHDNASDLDLGSVSPALLGSGRILQVGKSGTGYLLDAAHLGGIGGQLAQTRICQDGAYGGAAVDRNVVYVPCLGGGTAAVAVKGHNLHVLWHAPGAANGSPVVGGGAVWVTGWPSGQLLELDPVTGQVRHEISLGTGLPHFASPSLAGRLVLLGSLNGVVAVAGG